MVKFIYYNFVIVATHKKSPKNPNGSTVLNTISVNHKIQQPQKSYINP